MIKTELNSREIAFLVEAQSVSLSYKKNISVNVTFC